VKSATTVAKTAGAAFIASEALQAFGVLDVDDVLSDEHEMILLKLRDTAIRNVKDFRNNVRESLSPAKIEKFAKEQPKSAAGGAVGAFAGFLL